MFPVSSLPRCYWLVSCLHLFLVVSGRVLNSQLQTDTSFGKWRRKIEGPVAFDENGSIACYRHREHRAMFVCVCNRASG